MSGLGDSKTSGSASSAPSRESAPFGFRIVGSPVGELNRRLVHSWDEMLDAYCGAEPCAGIDAEAYSSPWRYPRAFATHLETNCSPKGYRGAAGASLIVFDIDRSADVGGVSRSLDDAKFLVCGLADRLGVPDRDLGVWFSGSKGFHVAIPTGGWDPEPSADLPAIAARFALSVCGEIGLRHPIAGEDPIDRSIYGHVQPLRLPNTPHPKTGLRKRWIEVDDLIRLEERGVRELAADPIEHERPAASIRYPRLAALWSDAAREIATRREANDRRPEGEPMRQSLNRTTVRVLRDGFVPEGSRHATFWSAARDLAEHGFTLRGAELLLVEPMRDSGLRDTDARRILRTAFDGAA